MLISRPLGHKWQCLGYSVQTPKETISVLGEVESYFKPICGEAWLSIRVEADITSGTYVTVPDSYIQYGIRFGEPSTPVAALS